MKRKVMYGIAVAAFAATSGAANASSEPVPWDPGFEVKKTPPKECFYTDPAPAYCGFGDTHALSIPGLPWPTPKVDPVAPGTMVIYEPKGCGALEGLMPLPSWCKKTVINLCGIPTPPPFGPGPDPIPPYDLGRYGGPDVMPLGPTPFDPLAAGTEIGNPDRAALMLQRMQDGTIKWDFSPYPWDLPDIAPATARSGGFTGFGTLINPAALADGGWHSKGG